MNVTINDLTSSQVFASAGHRRPEICHQASSVTRPGVYHEKCALGDLLWSEWYLGSELDSRDASIVETQISMLMKTCILPLAKQTNAVIFVEGANNCALSTAFANVVWAEQARRERTARSLSWP